jgi:rhamnogalacturonyl hydrolase YesR
MKYTKRLIISGEEKMKRITPWYIPIILLFSLSACIDTGAIEYPIGVDTCGYHPSSILCDTDRIQYGVVASPPMGDQIDQSQTIQETGAVFCGLYHWAQSFVPSLKISTRAELYMMRYGLPPDEVTVSIRETPDGASLTSLSIDPDLIPQNEYTWIEFDYDDIDVIPGNTYYIVCETDGGDPYSDAFLLGSSDGDSYSSGEAWFLNTEGGTWVIWEPEFDFCFITYGKNESLSDPPLEPRKPKGPSFGFTGTLYSFSTSTTDPNDDDIFYLFDWGDGTDSGWIGPYESGDTVKVSKSWMDGGTYDVKTKAKDTFDEESGWSLPRRVMISPYLSPEWHATYSNAWATSVKNVDGYVYVSGSLNRIRETENDFLLLKYDTEGTLTWTKTHDEYPYDALYGMDVHEGNIYLAGYGSDWRSAIYYSDIVLLKCDIDGNFKWAKTHDLSTYDFAHSLIVSEDCLFVGGQSGSQSLLMKFDLDGELLWERTFEVGGQMYSTISHIHGYGGFLYATGHTQDEKGDEDISLLKCDHDGNVLWHSVWDAPGTQKALGLCASADYLYVTGFGDVDSVDATGLLLKYSTEGTQQWYSTFDHYRLCSVEEDDGFLYVAGENAGCSEYPSDWDIVFARFDAVDGILLDRDEWTSSGCELARSFDVDDGTFYIAGSQGDRALLLKYGLRRHRTAYPLGREHPVMHSSIAAPENNEPTALPESVSLSSPLNLKTQEDSMEYVTGAANWLISLAEPSMGGYRWPTSEVEEEYMTNFYDGAPGVCLFLLRAYEKTGEESYLEYAEGGMQWLIALAVDEGGGYKWPESDISSSYYTGYYVGAAGIGDVFLDFHRSLGDPLYLEYAEGAARWIIYKNGMEEAHEIIMGTAGIGKFFLYLFETTGNPTYLAYAETGGDWLIDNARECPVRFLTEVGNPLHISSVTDGGCLWITQEIPFYWITSTGFAHGTSGPAYFLSELYRLHGKQRFLDQAEKAVRWILHEAVIEGDGDRQWRLKYDLNSEYSPYLYATGWCYGTPGIGSAILSIYRATGDALYLETLKKGTHWLMEQAIPEQSGYRWTNSVPRVERQSDYSITQRCCGVAGVGYYLLDLYEILGDPDCLEYGLGAVEWLKDVAVETTDGYKWWLTTSYHVAYTGHHTGAAGIGLLILKSVEL